MRLIDADALEKDAEWDDREDGFISYSQAAIDTAPTIDAVPVVRCGECKWFYESDTVICCEKHTGLALARKDDYCSYGERRRHETCYR